MHPLHAIFNTIKAQTFSPGDLAIVLLLVVLEGVLSIDNALVLGLLARKLPKSLRSRALTYGLGGALIFRLIAIFLASWLMHWSALKLIGGLYLVYLGVRHLLPQRKPPPRSVVVQAGRPVCFDDDSPDDVDAGAIDRWCFWRTVLIIELTDLTVAVDSILAAIALVSEYAPAQPSQAHPKLWIVAVGGMLGVVLMRIAAVIFIKVLERFPRFESTAYLLVAVIGVKLILDWGFNEPGGAQRIDFQSPSSGWFWAFWGAMLLCFCVGFLPRSRKAQTTAGATV